MVPEPFEEKLFVRRMNEVERRQMDWAVDDDFGQLVQVSLAGLRNVVGCEAESKAWGLVEEKCQHMEVTRPFLFLSGLARLFGLCWAFGIIKCLFECFDILDQWMYVVPILTAVVFEY